MLDWNWRILRNLLVFAIVVGLACVFAVTTDTVRFAFAGGMLALVLQTAIYWVGSHMGVRQGFDPSRPLHQVSRWDNMAFRTVKVLLEMALIAGMLYVGVTRFAQPAAVGSFVAFGVILTGVPLPVLAWAFMRKVMQPSVHAMSAGNVRPMPPAPMRPVATPTARPAPPAIANRPSPPALPQPLARLPQPAGRAAPPQAVKRPPAPPPFDDSVL